MPNARRRGRLSTRQLLAGFGLATIGLTLTSGGAALAAPPPAATDVRISIDARGVPLGKLLHEFAALARVEQLAIDPRIENVLVTVKIDDAPAAEAFRAALRAAGVDFAIWGEQLPDLRIVARAPEKAIAGASVAAPARASGAPARRLEPVSEKEKGMEAIMALAEAVEPAEAGAAEPPASHPDPFSAFVASQTAAPTPTVEAVASPAQVTPFTPLTGPTAAKEAPEAAVPANLPDDPFARYLTMMSAKKPPKQ